MEKPNKDNYYRELMGVISNDTNKPERFDYTQFIVDQDKYIDYLISQSSTGGIEREALNPDFVKVIDNIEENLKWISVEDRLPEHNTKVVVWQPESLNIRMTGFYNGKWMFDAGSIAFWETVTHWRHLPQPPTE